MISFIKLYNSYLNYDEQKNKITTNYKYKKNIDKHILPYFKSIDDIKKITSKKLAIWRNDLEKRKSKYGKALTINSKNTILRMLKSILEYGNKKYGVKIDLTFFIPFRNDEIENNKSVDDNYLSFEEFQKFINVFENEFNNYRLIFMFLYYSGLRLNEMNALEPKDYDSRNNSISVGKNLLTKTGKRKRVSSTKSKASNRIVPLPSFMQKYMLYLVSKNSKTIFGGKDYLAETTLRRKLDNYIELAKVRRITPHGFRHSYASLLINDGASPEHVCKLMGHSSVAITIDLYYHWFPNLRQELVQGLNKYAV